MKALTICQPYAELIARCEKPVENRTWPTKYRGLLAIHAGKSRVWLNDADLAKFKVAESDLVFGAVIAIARLADCVKIDDIHRQPNGAWLSNHIHVFGPWCWLLEDVVRLATPVPYTGVQGLFDIPDAVLR